MNEFDQLLKQLSSIILQSSPLIIAVCGETITERAGLINLSLDGTMLLAAMTGFVVGLQSNSVIMGFLAAAIVGMLFALIIAFGSIRLKQSQVAIGFVLTLLGDDLSAFLGQNFTRIPGVFVKKVGIPILEDIPILGPLFFDQDLVVYFALILVGVTWWFFFRTQPGLKLRGVGERPEAAFARGVKVNQLRYFYAMLGGALVGIAGAAYSLDVKVGWSEGNTRGLGWIALAIVIFGGWSPIRGAIGALLFGATKTLATILQQTYSEIGVVFTSITWILMLAVLLVSASELTERFINFMPSAWRRPLRRFIRVTAPMALGTRFGED
mgnify:CR=1 FL=1